MSKTIEIISVLDRGRVGLTVKGESRKIPFENKGGVSVAMVDHDEAAILLSLPGRGFWKEGVELTEIVEGQQGGMIKTPDETAEKPPAEHEVGETGLALLEEQAEADRLARETAAVLTAEGYAGMTRVTVLREALVDCTDKALIAALIQTEAGTEKPREKWLEALNTRLTELG